MELPLHEFSLLPFDNGWRPYEWEVKENTLVRQIGRR